MNNATTDQVVLISNVPQLSRDCMEPCFESALRLDGLLPPVRR